MTPDDPRHGTVNGYSNLACRCQPCRDAHSANFILQRADRSKRLAEATHGKATTYTNWLCRCRPCTDAWAVTRAAVAARRKARAS